MIKVVLTVQTFPALQSHNEKREEVENCLPKRGRREHKRSLTLEAIREAIYNAVAEVTIASFSLIQVGKRKLISKAEMSIIAYMEFHCREQHCSSWNCSGEKMVNAGIICEFSEVNGRRLQEREGESGGQVCLNIN